MIYPPDGATTTRLIRQRAPLDRRWNSTGGIPPLRSKCLTIGPRHTTNARVSCATGGFQRRRRETLRHAVRLSHPGHHRHQDEDQLQHTRSVHVPCRRQRNLVSTAHAVRLLQGRRVSSRSGCDERKTNWQEPRSTGGRIATVEICDYRCMPVALRL